MQCNLWGPARPRRDFKRHRCRNRIWHFCSVGFVSSEPQTDTSGQIFEYISFPFIIKIHLVAAEQRRVLNSSRTQIGTDRLSPRLIFSFSRVFYLWNTMKTFSVTLQKLHTTDYLITLVTLQIKSKSRAFLKYIKFLTIIR